MDGDRLKIGLFQPTWRRAITAVLVALFAFFIPQEAPLEWYPLNDRGPDGNYLEISCAANINGYIQIFFDLGHGINGMNSFRWPVSPTKQVYTYTFPLPDAPIVGLTLKSLPGTGELTIEKMRILNGNGRELRRFTKDSFHAQRQIAAIEPTANGWKLISTYGATDSYAQIKLLSPILATGRNHRNLLRCLLSSGYLSLMLWILLLAVCSIFYRENAYVDLLRQGCFMGFLAGLFALVGNRGLILNSIQYSQYKSWPIEKILHLELDVIAGDNLSVTELSWSAVDESKSVRQICEPHRKLQVVRFTIPNKPLYALNISGNTELTIREIRVTDEGQRTLTMVPLPSLQSVPEQISPVIPTPLQGAVPNSQVKFIFNFTAEAVARINAARPSIPSSRY